MDAQSGRLLRRHVADLCAGHVRDGRRVLDLRHRELLLGPGVHDRTQSVAVLAHLLVHRDARVHDLHFRVLDGNVYAAAVQRLGLPGHVHSAGLGHIWRRLRHVSGDGCGGAGAGAQDDGVVDGGGGLRAVGDVGTGGSRSLCAMEAVQGDGTGAPHEAGAGGRPRCVEAEVVHSAGLVSDGDLRCQCASDVGLRGMCCTYCICCVFYT